MGVGPAPRLGASIAGPKAGMTPALPWLGCSSLGSNAMEGLTPSFYRASPNCPWIRQDPALGASLAPGAPGAEQLLLQPAARGGRGSGGSHGTAAAVSFSTFVSIFPKTRGGRRVGFGDFQN